MFTYLFLFFALGISYAKGMEVSASEPSSYIAKYGERDLVKIYPNPMVNEANIQLNEEVDLERSKVVIVFYNMVGSEVYHSNPFKEGEEKITRDMFKNAGIYFYQLKIDDKVVSTGRITVK